MEKLQIIYPYYENPIMLEHQFRTWGLWPRDLQRKVKIILVDDGSPKWPIAADHVRAVSGFVDIELYRVLVNIPWNQNGAHNLGFAQASDGWCLTTDIDHVLVEDQLRAILSLQLNEKNYYTFGRRQAGRLDTPFKPHPNSWLLTRKMFLDSGGYDEDFSGYYGSDSQFRRALTLVGRHRDLAPSPYLVVYDEREIPDANTREWGRKDSEYHSVRYPHLQKKRGRTYKATNPIRFPWERVL